MTGCPWKKDPKTGIWLQEETCPEEEKDDDEFIMIVNPDIVNPNTEEKCKKGEKWDKTTNSCKGKYS